jgi:energy-coupling factor transport system permease protein
MLGGLVFVHGVHLMAKMPASKIKFVWKTLLPVALLMATLRALFYPVGDPFWQWGILQFTIGGIAEGLALGLRLINMAFVVFAWLYTTDQTAIVLSLVKLKIPYEWGLTLALALRYIPTFQGTYQQIVEAQQSRGLDFSAEKGWKRVQRMMPIFVAMIISSLKASNQLAMALEARAFGAVGVQRTYWRVLSWRGIDGVVSAGIFLTLITVIFLRIRYNFGVDPLHIIQ